ncbi:MAG TPA: hypothetical protein VGD99_22610 [Anaerolineae bacterium]|jgi:hypothetical protein
MNEKVETFSIAAQRFCEWAESNYPVNSQSLKHALELIAELFLLGLRLADEFKEIDEDSPSVEAAEDKTRAVVIVQVGTLANHLSEHHLATRMERDAPS